MASARDQREALLDNGMKLAHQRGFGATGVREFTAAAGVPQGSFTNHFRSKEAFGVLLLDRYEGRIDALMRETLDDESRSPKDRLRAYFDLVAHNASQAGWQHGCMVPDLAAEISGYGDNMRERVGAAMRHQTAKFESVVRLLMPGRDAEAADLAALLLAAWHGTMLRMKVEQSPAAIDRFRKVIERLLPQA